MPKTKGHLGNMGLNSHRGGTRATRDTVTLISMPALFTASTSRFTAAGSVSGVSAMTHTS